jgi:DNA-binding transcriptional LysR family regulator
MLSTHHLRVFYAVAREGSLGAAALTLGCTQPTVSHHIAALETELGTNLVVRQSRGVALTDRGRVLLSYAERVLAELNEAERAVRNHADLREGMLRVGAFSTAAASFLPLFLARFRDKHPGVRITVVETDDPEATVADVRTGQLDVGLLYRQPDDWARSLPGLTIRTLFNDPLHIALPASHPLAKRTSIALEELADESWMVARSDDDPLYRLFIRACQDAGFEPGITMRSDNYTVISGFVEAGLGIALIPQLGLPLVGERVAIVEVAGKPLIRKIHAVTLADGASITATAFMQSIRHATRSKGVATA